MLSIGSILFLIFIFSLSFLPGILFADSTVTPPLLPLSSGTQPQLLATERERIEDLIRIYQVSIDSINRQTDVLMFISAVFGIFVMIVVAFFAIKQLLADKEIRDYKEVIKQERISVQDESRRFRGEVASSRKWLANKKDEVEEEKKKFARSLRASPEEAAAAITKIEQLEQKIAKFENDLAFRAGRLSASPYTGTFSFSPLGSPTHLGLGFNEPSQFDTCSRCGRLYTDHAKNLVVTSANPQDQYICPTGSSPPA